MSQPAVEKVGGPPAKVEAPPVRVEVPPMDEFNKALVSNVHPPDWVNPTPAKRYSLVVIGAGTAGLVTAAAAAGLGAKVALIERHLMGGDCLNVGCVPSKCIITSGRAAANVMNAHQFGVRVPDGMDVDFPAVMERMRRLRAQISEVDGAPRFAGLGIDVFLGNAQFTGSDTVEVGDTTLRFKKAVIATGARAAHLSINGLEDAGYLTNETIFNLTERPQRLAVIGAGPIGCELAQTFRRLGSEIFLLHDHQHILDREDADAANIVQQAFVREGIRLLCSSEIQKVAREASTKVIHYDSCNESGKTLEVDEILVGVGRVPNIDSLNLDAVGVQYEKYGVVVNDKLQTTNSRIYAAGDVCMRWKFTHAADFAARIVIQNALFFGRKKLSALTMPWCTYTDPEIAHVGMYENEAEAKGIEVDTFIKELKHVDRAIAEGDTEGFVKIHVKKGTDKILGATIVARHAGEMISEITLAMVNKVGLGSLASVIHPYPTQAEAIRHTGDLYNRTRLTPLTKLLLRSILKITG